MLFNSEAAIGIIINTPPTADLEASELALALAAFDLPVKLFFIGLGVSWLLEQEPRKPQGKSASKVLSALPMYGVEDVFCSVESLTKLALEKNEISTLAKVVSNSELRAEISRCQHCLTF